MHVRRDDLMQMPQIVHTLSFLHQPWKPSVVAAKPAADVMTLTFSCAALGWSCACAVHV